MYFIDRTTDRCRFLFQQVIVLTDWLEMEPFLTFSEWLAFSLFGSLWKIARYRLSAFASVWVQIGLVKTVIWFGTLGGQTCENRAALGQRETIANSGGLWVRSTLNLLVVLSLIDNTQVQHLLQLWQVYALNTSTFQIESTPGLKEFLPSFVVESSFISFC